MINNTWFIVFVGDEDKTSYFNIDAVTGVISLALPLDREQQDILDNSGVLEFSVLVCINPVHLIFSIRLAN